MESIELITKSDKETKKLGEKLAGEIKTARTKPFYKGEAIIISLEGELGAGKTTFTQGFAKGLGIKETPKSPTFVIMRVYDLPNEKHSNFIHIDAYRISEKDLKALGWREFSKKPGNIILVEWGNIISKALPKNALRIRFKHGHNARFRIIKITE